MPGQCEPAASVPGCMSACQCSECHCQWHDVTVPLAWPMTLQVQLFLLVVLVDMFKAPALIKLWPASSTREALGLHSTLVTTALAQFPIITVYLHYQPECQWQCNSGWRHSALAQPVRAPAATTTDFLMKHERNREWQQRQ